MLYARYVCARMTIGDMLNLKGLAHYNSSLIFICGVPLQEQKVAVQVQVQVAFFYRWKPLLHCIIMVLHANCSF